LIGSGRRELGALTYTRHRVAAGDTLHNAGDPFVLIHAVHTGALKSSLLLADGREQVCGFQLPGEVVGFDGLSDGRHQATVTALEDSETCSTRYLELVDASLAVRGLQHELHQVMGRELARGRRHLVMLSGLSAHERLATFLLDMAGRAGGPGDLPDDFVLVMSRAEIGSYLGMTLETVSRALSAFRQAGLLELDKRHVRITDVPGLVRALGGPVH
jgi:CRP/FNR family transcriptional regulator